MKGLTMHRESFLQLAFASLVTFASAPVLAQTAMGEIEGRPAPVSRRQCVGGANVGGLCNGNGDCPGSSCQTTNIFNLSVAVRFNATAAQLTTIQNAFTAASQILLDITDGQAQFGQVTILNNSTGNRGIFWITTAGGCATDTGSWGAYSGSNVTVSFAALSGANGPSCITHEFVHLAFDARDEYEARAAGCGGLTGAAQCPDSAQGPNSAAQGACLMECCGRVGTELCWGQAAGDNLAAGNHDATDITEQSRCRSNRSCWAQLGWSWPNTFQVPAGAPDPGTAGVAHTPLVFLQPAATARLVLVVDRSGSMSSESPTRLERLRTAALDIVDIAENGVELGVVSFSATATDDVALAALGANRTAYTTAINGLAASGATNIGDGLQHARTMIMGAGGVTASTAIILMTDGRNNRPSGNAQPDLQQKINQLLADGIPVFVTCTGDDLGLDSQCAEIAAGTNGTYVDSAEAALLPDRFVSFYEQVVGRHPVAVAAGRVTEGGGQPHQVLVEKGARVVTFVAQWRLAQVKAELILTDPKGKTYRGLPMTLGRFLRVKAPVPGTWTLRLTNASGTPGGDVFSLRTFIENPRANLAASLQRKVIQPGEAFHVCARPIYEGPLVGVKVSGTVDTPGGTSVAIDLRDDGQPASGDEIADDGTYCAMFKNTSVRGAYTFRLAGVANAVQPADHPHKGVAFVPYKPVDFWRWTDVSGTVDDSVLDHDHFKLYRVKGRAEPRKVRLIDTFGRSETALGPPLTLGTPVGKNGEEIIDRGAHLECYAADDRSLKPAAPASVEVRNQFGVERLAVGPARALCVPTWKNQEPSTLKLDHFKCYLAKAERVEERQVTLKDQFAKTRTAVFDPILICNPAQKNDELPVDRRTHLTCYRIRDQLGQEAYAGKEVATQNQFGRERLTLVRAELLCVPSTLERSAP